MTTTLTRPIPIFLALMAAAAAAIAIAVHRHAAAEIAPTPAQQALAAPLVAPIPAPGESTQRMIDRYTAALAAAPRDPSAHDNLAFAELQMAREDGDPIWYTKADRLLHRALTLSPRDFSALDGMGS